jgi:hypothetical protein
MPDLYESDFYAWIQQQSEAIRAGIWNDIDRENLAEEIESLPRSDAHRLWQHLRELMVWLLAYAYAPEQQDTHSHWYVRVVYERCEIDIILGVWPHLSAKVTKDLDEAYAHGREVAIEETGLPPEAFPETCPWTPEQVLTASLEGPNSPFFGEPS